MKELKSNPSASRTHEELAYRKTCYGSLVILKPKRFSKFDLDRAEEYAQLLDLIWQLEESKA